VSTFVDPTDNDRIGGIVLESLMDVLKMAEDVEGGRENGPVVELFVEIEACDFNVPIIEEFNETLIIDPVGLMEVDKLDESNPVNVPLSC
jgi:hypothetical protein